MEQIAVVFTLGYSGNVGKTMVSHNLLAPRLNADVFSIETFNETIENDETLKIKAEQLNDVLVQIVSRSAGDRGMVVDVGSSNIEKVLKRLELSGGAQEDITGWVIPVTPFAKTQKDSVKTVEALLALGVSKKSIVLIRNMVENEDTMDVDFITIDGFCKKNGIKILEEFIPKLELITELALSGATIGMAAKLEITPDDIKAAKTEGQKLDLASSRVMARAARYASKKLDDVFNEMSKNLSLGITV